MATLNIPQNGKAVKGRTQKPLPSVDLTAMVDLAFLLITFFMLTTSLSKMNGMDIAKPIETEITGAYPQSRTMTILLGDDNKAVYYMGEAKNAVMDFVKLTEIQTQILNNKRRVAQTHQTSLEKEMIVIIKPTDKSSYKNFVDIIDEMNISGIEKYTIDDKFMLEQEKNFMKTKGI